MQGTQTYSDYSTVFREHLGFLVKEARKHGVPVAQLVEETSKALGPVVAEEASDGYAAREEGLADLYAREGGVVSLAEAAKLYRPQGVSRQALSEALRDGAIIGNQSGRRGYVVPVWQFRREGGLLPGLDKALAALKQLPWYNPIVPFTFLLQEHPVTENKTPLEALRAGKVDQVLRAIEADAHG